MSYPETPPSRLSSDPNHADFHPSYRRVGVRIDGQELSCLIRYDVAAGRYWTRDKPDVVCVGEIEPFWRWAESRQERRARERWDAKSGVRG